MPTLSSLLPYVRTAAPIAAGAINRRAAGNATQDLIGGVNNAIGTVTAGGAQVGRTLADVYAEQKKLLEPYTAAGMPATQNLAAGVAPGGDLVKPFDASTFDLYKDPGYQWRVQQGNRAIEAGANASGTRFSGATLKALSAFNQESASQEFSAARNRAEQDQQNQYDRLMGVSNIGQNAASTEVAAGGTYGANLGRVQQATAEQIAGLQTDLASAQAAGDVAKANTITDLIDKATSGLSLASAAPGVASGAATAGIPAVSSIAGPAAASGLSLASAATPSLAAITAGAVPEIPLGATIGGNIALGGSAAGGLAGTAGATAAGTAAPATGLTGALGLGGGSGLMGLGAATIPIVGGIIAGGILLANHYIGAGRKQADKLTDEGGLQNSFEKTLATIRQSNQSPEQQWQSSSQAYDQLEKFGLEFAAKGKNQHKAASQMFDEISHLFGRPNPLKAAV